MLQRMRHSTVLSLLVLLAFATVLGGKEVVHYMFAHTEVSHVDLDTQDCCEPDHRLPHFHAQQYCFLCDIDVSVTLHAERLSVQPPSLLLDQEVLSDKVGVYQPRILSASLLRGPPAVV